MFLPIIFTFLVITGCTCWGVAVDDNEVGAVL